MSTSNEPGGRPSEAVFRRRRIVVGLGILAVIVAIVLIIVRPGSASENGAQPSASPGVTAGTSAAPDASAAPSAAAGGPCDPGKVSVVAETDQVNYDAGVPVSMTMTVTNTGTASCELNVGTAAQVFTVTSGAEQYWTSTDCQINPADAKVLLEPGVPASSTTPVEWDRTRSDAESCDAERAAAPGDGASYYLTVSIDGISSEPAQFLLY